MEILLPIILIVLLIGGITIFILRIKHLKTTVNEVMKKPVVLKISVPINNDRSPLSAEQLFQAFHGVLRGGSKAADHFSFEIIANSLGIYFIVVCEARYQRFVENQIYAQYPDAQITHINDYILASRKINAKQYMTGIEMTLRKEIYLPINTFQNFEVDPLASITSAMSKLQQFDEVWIQVLARPITNEWQNIGKSFINSRKQMTDAEGKKVALESGESQAMREIERKNTKSGFQFVIRMISKSMDGLSAQQRLEDVQAAFNQFQTAQYNSLVIRSTSTSALQPLKDAFLGKRLGQKLNILSKYENRYLDEYETGVLNIEELASLYHLPSRSVQTPNIAWAKSKKIEPPQDLPTQHVRFMGVTDYRDIRIPFGIKKADRRRHMYLLGKTGTGKSLFIKNMVFGDIRDGEGFGVIDPHGDLVEEILNLIPEHRIKDVVYLDPSDVEFPIGLNMLDLKEGESMELLADGIVSVFIKLFGHSWGPRLQYILTNTILTLLHCQNVSLLAVQRILLDKNYRRFLLKQVKDPFLLKFWEEEYEQMAKNPKLITEAIAPIQNKVGRFLSSPMVRNMIGQVKSSIDLREIMDSGKILLVNLSQGKIGEENTALLGGMIITRLYTNAMQRANVDESQRKDFYLYVDEFQNFATDTFVKILSEARKYGLNLMVTHQYIDQLPMNIQDAVFGNVGTLMNYVVGPKDAERLAKEFKPDLTPEDLVNLERFSMVLKLTIDGAQSKPFTAKVGIPSFQPLGFKDQVKEFNRKTYASSRVDVDMKLNKWATQSYDDKGNLVQK